MLIRLFCVFDDEHPVNYLQKGCLILSKHTVLWSLHSFGPAGFMVLELWRRHTHAHAHILIDDHDIGLFLNWVVPQSITMNKGYDYKVLCDHLTPSLCKRHSTLLINTLLHDNATPHAKCNVHNRLESWE